MPLSVNPGFDNGCEGAVWDSGTPAAEYCKNTGRANGRYAWHQACCKWENKQCIPKTNLDGKYLLCAISMDMKYLIQTHMRKYPT